MTSGLGNVEMETCNFKGLCMPSELCSVGINAHNCSGFCVTSGLGKVIMEASNWVMCLSDICAGL